MDLNKFKVGGEKEVEIQNNEMMPIVEVEPTFLFLALVNVSPQQRAVADKGTWLIFAPFV